MFFVFLASGLFLGWSLGANDAANVFGTAVGTRMVKFRTAAIACSIFVVLGAVVGGAGTSHTLGKLGAVNALAGSFTVALAAGLTVAWMTRLRLPVSTSQAIVGAIVGWNLFSGSLTDMESLTQILSSWILCPILAGVFAVGLLKLTQLFFRFARFHLFTIDSGTRLGLLVVGAFASYSLGANNIANVMGVFVPSSPLGDLHIMGLFKLSGDQQLFFLGAIAIGVGVFTYSKKVMLTVGNDLFRLSPIAALIVVLAQAIVLFLFSSEQLENLLASNGLPTLPLVPVSSSQAVIGAVVGVGLAKGGRNIKWGVLGRIASGWVSTPLIAGLISFVCLYFVQNVFSQKVHSPIPYEFSHQAAMKLRGLNTYGDELDELIGKRFKSAVEFQDAVGQIVESESLANGVVELSELHPLLVDVEALAPQLDYHWYSKEQVHAVFRLHGRRFDYAWQLADALASISDSWRLKPSTKKNKLYNKGIKAKLQHLNGLFLTNLAPPN
ncbi:MAG: phosphate permease [Deltaproteobacteria bacterium RIFOXYA12_FULL_58_15]|nr:MAG: phosphate permease [Deltaproteobacteria bacterium RIFOXYA12_FULL_58_15]